MSYNLFICGTSDIASEIAKNFNKNKNICVCRNIKKAKDLNFSRIIKLDLAKEINFKVFKCLKKSSISNIFFFNGYQDNNKILFYKKKLKDILLYYTINVISSLKIFSFLQHNRYLSKYCKIIFFSSRAGSISERGVFKHHLPGGDNLYRSAKAALNSFVKNLAFENFYSNFTIVSYHPGWIKTKMGGNNADMTVKEASKFFVKFLTKISKKNSGKFYNYDLKEIGW
jgi:NAD(P)-dependent dehydrogenase (short-subunit alcohol dehydrogenase family)